MHNSRFFFKQSYSASVDWLAIRQILKKRMCRKLQPPFKITAFCVYSLLDKGRLKSFDNG